VSKPASRQTCCAPLRVESTQLCVQSLFPFESTACHYTISEQSREFTSPNYHSDGYPNSQFCSWRFLVQKTAQIMIKFPEFNLQKGKDGDVVRIYSGWDAKAPLLAEFNGDRPPPAKGVASKTSVVYLVFQSDSRRRSRGFRGLFLNQSKYTSFFFLVKHRSSSYYKLS